MTMADISKLTDVEIAAKCADGATATVPQPLARPTKKRRAAGSRTHQTNSTAGDAYEDFIYELESLREEIEGWKESLEGNNMEHLPKYEEVCECYDVLEAARNALPDHHPECLSDAPVIYTRDTRQSATTRSGRLSNAQNAMSAVVNAADEWLESNPELEMVYPSERDHGHELAEGETDDEAAVESRADERAEVEEFLNALQEADDEVNNASFPGMY